MKLLSKQRDGRKVSYRYDLAKTPLQRLLLSGILPAEKQHELNAVAHSLDPLRLFHQLEQLQKAMFRCAVEGNPFVSNVSSLPIRVFYKDPFKGAWERITSWLMANPEREPRRHFPGATASLPRTLSTTANPHAPARDEENTSPPGLETVEEQWQTEVIRGASPPPVSSAAKPTRIS